ncbi:uncharacterized protein LOC129598904 [Paramacrobiotus metropolitanus]|uniref:uncharacterized protein LOC129598904 n=1 Tax=Paramacrobiotus metropolitanus TaxID=2943436 RepID=UPI0024459FB7|nr:uncharacterized protein LOC129598904 [Paramacrobiotus metropolitanus]XP_055352969.1 uncharacterized protein LOC129598904 [Paramacrobiotus metropolitanus]
MRYFLLLILLIKLICGWRTRPGDPQTAPYFPHPLCHYSGPYKLTCSHADLYIPGNFRIETLYSNTSRIYNDVNTLILDCPTSTNRTYCNTIGPGATALSHRFGLWHVTLIGFQAEGGGRAPIDVLLAEVPSLHDLRVHYSKIGTLDRHFLRRFTRLGELDVRNNDISAIETDTFEPLVDLEILRMGGNALQTLDWSVLKTVAKTLRLLEADAQNPPLHTLRRSGSLFLMNITKLSLNHSRLSSVPKEVVDTFDVRQYGDVTLDIQHNPVCRDKADCTCCDMKDLAGWFVKRSEWATRFGNLFGTKPWSVTVKATCGSTWNTGSRDAVKEFTPENPLLPSMYANCH